MIAEEVDGKVKFSGFCVDLLDKLSEELSFKYELHLSPDGVYGIANITGHWTGMIGEVIAGVSTHIPKVDTERVVFRASESKQNAACAVGIHR
ncbi:hypothetical protein HPB48_016359 [Haemaphysalis longicornis]|uniref:Ionotropic glutamate receptor L-glutamate and glycine-binding domain-containing protein n=1 Tax=Haemaphysalis longicornis TaxID=44386 RepID=A0A9J6H596_HAELO|nr:hypothetical protein HPB48_016359 [Haemaphysalis longicornis]